MELSFFIAIFAALMKVQHSYGTVSPFGSQNIQSEALSELVSEKVASMEPHFKFLTDAVKDMPFSLLFQYFLKLSSLDPKLRKLNRIMNDIHDYVNGSDAKKKNGNGGQKSVQSGAMQSKVQNANPNNHQTGIAHNEEKESDRVSLPGGSKEEIEEDYESYLQMAKQEYHEAKAAAEDCYRNSPAGCDEVRRKLMQKVETVKLKASEWKKRVDEAFNEGFNIIKGQYENEVEAVNAKMKKIRSECEETHARGKKKLEESTNTAAAEKHNAQKQYQEALSRAKGSAKRMAKLEEYKRKAEAKYAADIETATKKWEQVRSELFGKWNRTNDECQKTINEKKTGQDKLINELGRIRADSAQIYEKIVQKVTKEFESTENLYKQKKGKLNEVRNGVPINAQNMSRAGSKKVNNLDVMVPKRGKSKK